MKTGAAARAPRLPRLDLVPPSTSAPLSHAARAYDDKLWLALHLPQLPLHALGWVDVPDRDSGAHAVSVRQGRRAVVLAVNAWARRAGVTVGMNVAGACCICPRLNVHARDEVLEHAALEGLALWSGRYTAVTVLQPPRGVLLEVGASLRLFNGLGPLLTRVNDDLRTLGHAPAIAVAPTARAAWLLARFADARPVTLGSQLANRLAAVPVSCLELQPKTLQDLEVLGVRTVGECIRLPRDGLLRRFGPELLTLLDEALGTRADVRQAWAAPARFQRRVELPWESRDHAMLLRAAERLLKELEGFLTRRAVGVGAVEIHIGHHARTATRFTLQLMSPVRDAGYLLSLLSQRLERLTLPADAVHLGLRATLLRPLAPVTQDLYGEPSVRGAAGVRDAPQALVERLVARLGRERVHGLMQRIDPRPERTTVHSAWGSSSARVNAEHDPIAAGMPLWLLEEPRRLRTQGELPCLHQVLCLEQGPQRIEGGWWDGGDVTRDYYVARGASGERYWVFRDRRMPRHWYLHGIFA